MINYNNIIIRKIIIGNLQVIRKYFRNNIIYGFPNDSNNDRN